MLAETVPVAAPPPGGVPEEGATGWSDTWVISSEAAHPNCMYKWMNYIASPPVQAQVMQWFGEAPAQSKACETAAIEAADKALGLPADPKFCENYHAAEPGFWNQVYFWQTPLADCGDDRGNV